jgi:hypothetical protein
MTEIDVYYYDHYLWIVPYIVVIYFTVRILLMRIKWLDKITLDLEKYFEQKKMLNDIVKKLKKNAETS